MEAGRARAGARGVGLGDVQQQRNKQRNERTNVHCPATCTEAPVVGAWFCDSDETQRAHYTARRAEIREALTPSAPTEFQDDGAEKNSGNEIPTIPERGRGWWGG